MSEYVRCPECGGFIDKGSCICGMAMAVREALKDALSIDDDELDRRLDAGEIYPIGREHAMPASADEDVVATEVPVTVEPFERTISDEEREAQRRSFAYGNTKLSNDDITRELVERVADDLAHVDRTITEDEDA